MHSVSHNLGLYPRKQTKTFPDFVIVIKEYYDNTAYLKGGGQLNYEETGSIYHL